ncbi:restriction endonuclease subunit S, partial [Polaribacter reichenbachii]
SPKIQSKIVIECDQLDLEFKKAQEIIEKESTSRNELYHKIYNSDLPLKTIEQISIDTDYGINEGMNTKDIGYKIFRMNEIINGYMYDNGEMKHVDITKEEFKKYKLESGDILFNRTNSIEHVGKTGLFNLKGEYCFASYLIRIKVNVKKAYPEYINYIMNSNNFQTIAKSKASKSINQANINATKMKAIKIPVPEDLNTQKAYNKEFKIYETKINKAQSIIDGIKKSKEEIIIKYLQK